MTVQELIKLMPLWCNGNISDSQSEVPSSTLGRGTFGTFVGSKSVVLPELKGKRLVSQNRNRLPTIDQSKWGYLVPSPA